VVEVGIKIGQALHAAHQVGIVHRDVKPSNILRSRFGPALTDFGIARAPDELSTTLTREMMTPHHASPEALLHQAQSGLSDVYSLASTMWALLVGHPPFVDPAKPSMDMYLFRDKVLHDPLPAMPRGDVPAWLVTELHRAMAKLPAQRHGSAQEFSEALQRGALGIEAPASTSRAPPVITPLTAVQETGVPADASPGTDPRLAALPVPPAAPAMASAPPVAPPPAVVPPVPVASPPLAAPPPAVAPPAPAPRQGPPPSLPPAVGPTPLPPAVPAPPLPSHSPARPLPSHPLAASPGPAAPPVEQGPVYQARPTPPAARLAPVTHPLGERPATPPPAEEGRWLGPRPEAETSAWPQVPVEPVRPRPLRDREVTAPSGGRRGGLVAVLAGVTVIAVVIGLLLFLRPGRDQPSAGPPPSDDDTSVPSLTVTATPSLGREGAPTDLKIEKDTGDSVTLVWTDPTGGTLSYVAVQQKTSDEDAQTQQVPPGDTRKTVTFTGLDPDRNYCFTVLVVYTVTNLATSDPECTHR